MVPRVRLDLRRSWRYDSSMEVPEHLMSRYIQRRRRDLEECQRALSGLRFDELARVGHQLKGNGLTFGHPELSSIGHNLELAATEHQICGIESALEDLSLWVESLH